MKIYIGTLKVIVARRRQ